MAAPASRVELYNDSASPIRTACVLALVEQTAAPDSPPYPFRSNEQSHAIVEIRSVEVQIEGSEHTARFLVEVFGFRANGRDGSVFRFKDRTSTSTVAIDLLCAPNSEPERRVQGSLTRWLGGSPTSALSTAYACNARRQRL
jgi:hypothetical protein